MQILKNSHWSQGLKLVQWMKNRALHSKIKMSPYKALFDCKVKHGINTSNLQKEKQRKTKQNFKNHVV